MLELGGPCLRAGLRREERWEVVVWGKGNGALIEEDMLHRESFTMGRRPWLGYVEAFARI